MSVELACFISPHGYGHATRTIAVLQALQKRIPKVRAQLFTTAPESMFIYSGISHSYHRLVTDIGLVQNDAFSENRPQTLEKLSELLPFSDALIERCVDLCRPCRLILCDISCLGIAIGHSAGIPSILVENFTWDWIYQMMGPDSGFEPYIELFAGSYQKADFRIQADPVCVPAPCDLNCLPIARNPRAKRDVIRAEIAEPNQKIILISMGGITLEMPFVGRLKQFPGYLFILAGQKEDGFLGDNVRLLGPASTLYHPDLIKASDLLICKSGYSTIAECLQTRTPICCVARNTFAESEVLEKYVTEEMNGAVIDVQSFLTGDWLDNLERLTRNVRCAPGVNGAEQAAEFIQSLI